MTPTTSRMQSEMWPAWIRANPTLFKTGLRSFLADARGVGLTQIKVVEWAGEVIVIATRPGDPEGGEVLI